MLNKVFSLFRSERPPVTASAEERYRETIAEAARCETTLTEARAKVERIDNAEREERDANKALEVAETEAAAASKAWAETGIEDVGAAERLIAARQRGTRAKLLADGCRAIEREARNAHERAKDSLQRARDQLWPAQAAVLAERLTDEAEPDITALETEPAPIREQHRRYTRLTALVNVADSSSRGDIGHPWQGRFPQGQRHGIELIELQARLQALGFLEPHPDDSLAFAGEWIAKIDSIISELDAEAQPE